MIKRRYRVEDLKKALEVMQKENEGGFFELEFSREDDLSLKCYDRENKEFKLILSNEGKYTPKKLKMEPI